MRVLGYLFGMLFVGLMAVGLYGVFTGGKGGGGGGPRPFEVAMGYGQVGMFDEAIEQLYYVAPKDPEFQKAQAKLKEYKTKKRYKDAKHHPEQFIKLVDMDWKSDGLGVFAYADVVLKNTSPLPVGDIKLNATFFGESGAVVGGSELLNVTHTYTLNRIIKPGETRRFTQVRFGVIPDEVARGTITVRSARAY